MAHDLTYLATLSLSELTKGQRIAASKAGLIPPVRSERERQLRARYGLTLEDYESLFLQGNSVCWICKEPWDRDLYVDHCHRSLRVRGLLCARCNTLVGQMESQRPDILFAAMTYLLPTLPQAIEQDLARERENHG